MIYFSLINLILIVVPTVIASWILTELGDRQGRGMRLQPAAPWTLRNCPLLFGTRHSSWCGVIIYFPLIISRHHLAHAQNTSGRCSEIGKGLVFRTG